LGLYRTGVWKYHWVPLSIFSAAVVSSSSVFLLFVYIPSVTDGTMIKMDNIARKNSFVKPDTLLGDSHRKLYRNLVGRSTGQSFGRIRRQTKRNVKYDIHYGWFSFLYFPATDTILYYYYWDRFFFFFLQGREIHPMRHSVVAKRIYFANGHDL